MIDATHLHERQGPLPMPVMSVEVMQLRAALDYWMALNNSYEKRLGELEQEIDAAYREVDRLNAVVAAYESR